VNEKHTVQQHLGSVLAGVVKIWISESQNVLDFCDGSTRQRVEKKAVKTWFAVFRGIEAFWHT